SSSLTLLSQTTVSPALPLLAAMVQAALERDQRRSVPPSLQPVRGLSRGRSSTRPASVVDIPPLGGGHGGHPKNPCPPPQPPELAPLFSSWCTWWTSFGSLRPKVQKFVAKRYPEGIS